MSAVCALGPERSSAENSVFPPLNNPATTLHLRGKFVWADLFANDAKAAADFYTQLFGWSAAPVVQKDRSYIVLSSGTRPIAGIAARTHPRHNKPSRWIPYVSVSDIRSVFEQVPAGGGAAKAPIRSFPNRGKQAIIADPDGSPIGLIQSSSGDPADDEPQPGDWNWFELFTRQPGPEAQFFEKLVGYEARPDTRVAKKDHFILSGDGRARGGIAPFSADHPDTTPGWVGFVRVSDVDAAVAKASALGGQVLIPPKAADFGSRFALVADPSGAAIGVVQFVENANPADQP
jgi:predicted enzyme related to lactoylglutathione lyase